LHTTAPAGLTRKQAELFAKLDPERLPHHIAVIMDIVWNHMSPTDNFLWNYDGTQEYFETPDVQTSWGSQCAFGKQGVADYYANSAQAWFDDGSCAI